MYGIEICDGFGTLRDWSEFSFFLLLIQGLCYNFYLLFASWVLIEWFWFLGLPRHSLVCEVMHHNSLLLLLFYIWRNEGINEGPPPRGEGYSKSHGLSNLFSSEWEKCKKGFEKEESEGQQS